MEDILFCTVCGSKMDSGSAHCPACGAPVADADPHSPARNSVEQYESNSKLKTVTALLLLGAAITLLLGIVCLAMVDIMADVYELMYTNMSLQQLQNMVRTSGYIAIGCGAMCLVSGIVVMKRINWILAFVFTLIATALGFYTSFLGGIFGILCLYYIYRYKAAFE